MDLLIKGRSALVLGSTSGLGLAVAEGLAAEGARTAFTGRRGDAARAAAADCPEAIGLELDLADPDSARRGLARAIDAHGPVDILVLNSGGPPPGTAADLTPEQLEASLRTLLLAHIDLVSLVLPGMRERKWGRIVALGSSGVQQPIAGLARSNAARAGLAGYLKTLAAEVAADRVTVNLVLPGRIGTGRVAEIDANRAKNTGQDIETVRAQSLATIPAGRYGTPAEFAAAAVFLASERASYITGSQVRVDGGLIASL